MLYLVFFRLQLHISCIIKPFLTEIIYLYEFISSLDILSDTGSSYMSHPSLELQNVVRFEDASCENTQSSDAAMHHR